SASEDPPALIAEVSGNDTRLDFGPVPGLGRLDVLVAPEPGFALWLVRGDLPSVANPPMELLRSSWAQLVYQPFTQRVTLGGLAPGRYTLVWASFHATMPNGPRIVPVQIPSSGEVKLF
ncbi:MAG: carboxypeptidase regulatory-like domain-containing protein, partial [Archangium sp.]